MLVDGSEPVCAIDKIFSNQCSHMIMVILGTDHLIRGGGVYPHVSPNRLFVRNVIVMDSFFFAFIGQIIYLDFNTPPQESNGPCLRVA